VENLRIAIESDLHDSIEGEFGARVKLTSPEGVTQIYSATNPTEYLKGQYLNFTKEVDPESGEVIIVKQPNIALRINSLTGKRKPEGGERWFVEVYNDLLLRWDRFVHSEVRAPMDGSDIGFIRLYLQRVEQQQEPVSI
jgi:hypothetical protein